MIALGIKSYIPELTVARQMIVVKVSNWSEFVATMDLFERAAGGEWKHCAGPFAAVIGRNGLRWGMGLHGTAPAGTTGKCEGDGCAPAGVFELDQVFGSAAAESTRLLKMPYIVTTADLEGVDDPTSRYYNRLVRRSEIRRPDWRSSEKMIDADGLYQGGVVVRHNWYQQRGCGSCIFLHLWRKPTAGTAGCTAFARDTVDTLLHWLDHDLSPVLVQLSASEYEARKRAWSLP
jgi:L,D-peptidoglycan transpeptidase YkuD (ErfK/YbiS/YcfS/YnhG family)